MFDILYDPEYALRIVLLYTVSFHLEYFLEQDQGYQFRRSILHLFLADYEDLLLTIIT